MDAITQSNEHHIMKLPPNANNPIPHRWYIVLAKVMSGVDYKEVAAETGYTLNSIYRILNDPNTILVRQQLLEYTQQEFENQFKLVTDTIREGLNNDDPKIRAIYTAQWLKAHGKLGDKKANSNVFTAEDMVVQIMNGNVEDAKQ
jgi:hypothetical protein